MRLGTRARIHPRHCCPSMRKVSCHAIGAVAVKSRAPLRFGATTVMVPQGAPSSAPRFQLPPTNLADVPMSSESALPAITRPFPNIAQAPATPVRQKGPRTKYKAAVSCQGRPPRAPVLTFPVFRHQTARTHLGCLALPELGPWSSWLMEGPSSPQHRSIAHPLSERRQGCAVGPFPAVRCAS